MGISIVLEILPDRISPEEWAKFYEEALGMSLAFRPKVMTMKREEVLSVSRWFYTTDLEEKDKQGRFFSLIGDVETGGTGESFDIYRDIEHYRRDARHSDYDVYGEEHILLAPKGVVRVFDSKTQGHPYHDLIWSIVTLAEQRFPGAGLANGTLDHHDWQTSLKIVEEVTGNPAEPPLRLSPAGLWEVLAQKYSGIELVERVTEELRCEWPGLISYMEKSHQGLLRDFLTARIDEYSPEQVGAIRLFKDYLDAGSDVGDIVLLAVNIPTWGWQGCVSCLVRTGLLDTTPKPNLPRAESIMEMMARSFNMRAYETARRMPAEKLTGIVSSIAGQEEKEVLAYLQEELKDRKEKLSTMVELDRQVMEYHEKVSMGEMTVNYDEAMSDIPSPHENIKELRRMFAENDADYSVTNLRGMALQMAEQKSVVLDKESWDLFDELDSDAALVVLIRMFGHYEGEKYERQYMQELIKRLPGLVEKWNLG